MMTRSTPKDESTKVPLPVTDLASAVRRLATKGIITHDRDCVSERVLGSDSCRYAGCSSANGSHAVEATLEQNCANPSWAHDILYQVRPDVGGIVEASSRWVGCLAALGREMPVVFDEQARQLGRSVPFLPSLDHVDAIRLGELVAAGNNACVMEGRMLCFGYSLERAVFNAELFEKCAMSFTLASLSGRKVGHIPWWVQTIASKRLVRDERTAAEAYSLGKKPIGLGGYA